MWGTRLGGESVGARGGARRTDVRGRGRWHGGARAVHVCGAVGSKGVWANECAGAREVAWWS